MEHVYFHDHYVTNEELFGYLTAIDIYITPYLNEAQITSGALSYAIGAGAAVISTPYWHAQEILADNRGKLFDFNDSNGLADILCELLDNPSELNKLRKEAYKYGRKTIWPEIGSQYLKLISKSIKSKQDLSIKKDLLINSLDQPNYSFINFRRFNIQIQEK